MAAEPYQPSNGTEGCFFHSQFCDQCRHERWTHFMEEDNEDDKCKIMSQTMLLDVTDPEYPKEWIYDQDGKPTCTKFSKWDWDVQGDANDPENPNYTTPLNPNQMTIFEGTEGILQRNWPQQDLVNE